MVLGPFLLPFYSEDLLRDSLHPGCCILLLDPKLPYIPHPTEYSTGNTSAEGSSDNVPLAPQQKPTTAVFASYSSSISGKQQAVYLTKVEFPAAMSKFPAQITTLIHPSLPRTQKLHSFSLPESNP